jgi:hypothetical protein
MRAFCRADGMAQRYARTVHIEPRLVIPAQRSGDTIQIKSGDCLIEPQIRQKSTFCEHLKALVSIVFSGLRPELRTPFRANPAIEPNSGIVASIPP